MVSRTEVSGDKALRLGVIGMSEGNGHPYSWPAIFNGYDQAAMARCPFPVIAEYLGQRQWPEDFLQAYGRVTHIWTQTRQLSEEIAAASRIDCVVDTADEMIGSVDAVLLARDDAENHLQFAAPFLDADVPVYVDKPLALSVNAARRLLERELWEGQLFTCSAMRFASELVPTHESVKALGELRAIESSAPRSWERYAIHAIEPAVAVLAREGLLTGGATCTVTSGSGGARRVDARLTSGVRLTFATTGTDQAPITMLLTGTRGELRSTFTDSFTSFRLALRTFVSGVLERRPKIARAETLAAIEMLSWGT